MNLQERIKKDLVAAMKAKDEIKKNTIRMVMGEMARLETKAASDADIIKIVKKLIKSEKEVIEKKGSTGPSEYIKILEAYLPQLASPEEIQSWIKENIDFSSFKNKMQAMGTIMKHFGSQADGNIVKSILQKL